MEGLCIIDAVKRFGVTSKTLRYYERVGLLEAKRSDDNNYRYYNEPEVERIGQIMILRKMQISIKDIIRIYENDDMSMVVETFVKRIRVLDDEIDALSELRRITNDFLQTMIDKGIKKISALPLLYEELDKKLAVIEDNNPTMHRDSIELNVNSANKPTSYQDLITVTEKLAKPVDFSIILLPAMRILSSELKENPTLSDPGEFFRWVQSQNIDPAIPGSHERFEYQDDAGDITVIKITDEFENTGPYIDRVFDGGLFAVANIYLDDDLSERFRSLISGFDDNKYYEIDYLHDGTLRHKAMLENLISPDEKRELVSLLVPVKKRLVNPGLFDKATEIEPSSVMIAEIESADKIVWSINAAPDKLIPLNDPHYRFTPDGEAEYISWISTRVLSTGVNVKLPFRVDVEFRIGEESGGYGHGVNDTAVLLYHGNHGLDHNVSFGVNMENNADERLSKKSIIFSQPIYKDRYTFPERGELKIGEYNRVTWIVGENHLACIINDEIRYCGTGFPYMKTDFDRLQSLPIIIGTNSSIKTYIKSICVSQLAHSSKIKIEKGALTMITKQSNNMIRNIHRLVTDEYGENYWFNGCAKYVMECLDEPDYDYWFFAGLTGDIFTQHYAYTKYSGDAFSSYMMDEDMAGNPEKFIEETFAKCGYAATYVSNQVLQKNTEMYMNTLITYIDKGIPVIVWGTPLVGVFVGYEDYGKILLYITGNSNEPVRVPLEKVVRGELEKSLFKYKSDLGGWVFVGEKKENIPLDRIYREAIRTVPQYFKIKTDAFCFGPEAFRAWAKDIENGKFDDMPVDDFDAWAYHTNYICVLATNGSCCHGYLKKAQELNPDMTYLEEVSRLYKRTADIWNNDNGNDLEALGGGFNVTLEALQDKEKRSKIAAKIYEAADCTDEVVKILENKRR